MDISGEAEIALKRVEDAEPETVRHSRHVQGHAPHTAPMTHSGVGGKGRGKSSLCKKQKKRRAKHVRRDM
jgi:hypothetical protein